MSHGGTEDTENNFYARDARQISSSVLSVSLW
jgi:hypothetical protein